MKKQDKGPSDETNDPLPIIPTIEELISQGVPEDIVPSVIGLWDLSIQYGDREDIRLCQRIIRLYTDDPDIPFQKAKIIAELELEEEKYDVPESNRLSVLAKRYKPWKGGLHGKMFLSMANKRRTAKKSSKQDDRS